MNCSQKVIGFLALTALLTLCLPPGNVSMGLKTFSLHSVALAADQAPKEKQPGSFIWSVPQRGAPGETPSGEEAFGEEPVTVADPLEPMNRFFFHFNDKLYFWVLKPVGTAYGTVLPPGIRIAIRNAFHNIAMPVRVINCALQGKGEAMGTELGRFVINSTLGIGGLVDFAYNEYGLKVHDEDTGQTFGVWGMKPLMYVNLPILGPSSVRDGLGLAGDTFLNPVYYLTPNDYVSLGVKAGKEVNNVSLRLGEYEDFKKSALDPYISMRDAYIQYRAEEIKK